MEAENLQALEKLTRGKSAGGEHRVAGTLRRYGLALLLFAAVIGLSVLLTRLELKVNLTIPVIMALVITAWYGGRGPGLLLSGMFQTTTVLYAVASPGTNLAITIFGYFSTLSLYVFLTLIISGVRKIQNRLSEQRDLLSVMLSSIGDAVIATDTQTRVTFMNQVAQELTGWDEAAARGHPLSEVFCIEDEDSGESVANPVERVLAAGPIMATAEHIVLRRRDGHQIPIINTAAPLRDGDRMIGSILVFSDISERRSAERSRRENEIMRRIVDAQESERLRIARDLHDHLGQQMTALRLQIESVKPAWFQGSARPPGYDDLIQKASNIDRDIAFLSWELRPTELEELGLENAIGGFVREWSNQYGIEAQFCSTGHLSDTGDLRLPPAMETNLYRIVQEALNNVLKHSDAHSVQVLFRKQGNSIVMMIEDDGLGFDMASSLDSQPPSGVGIVGMRERAALLNGSLEIDSKPGSGTTVLIQVPAPTKSPVAA